MGAITYFPPGGDYELGEVKGSSFGEPDGTTHSIELLEGNGSFILRVELQGSKAVDLLLTKDQAIHFTEGAKAILSRLGIKN